MPKLKSNSSFKKRFKNAAKNIKKAAKGIIKRGSANRSHILTKMSTKRKRDLRTGTVIKKCDKKSIIRGVRGS